MQTFKGNAIDTEKVSADRSLSAGCMAVGGSPTITNRPGALSGSYPQAGIQRGGVVATRRAHISLPQVRPLPRYASGDNKRR